MSAIAIVHAIFGLRTTVQNVFPQRLYLLFLVISTLCLTQASYGILQYFHFLLAYNNYRMVGSFDNPAGFASSLSAGLPFAFYCFHDKRTYIKWYSAIVITLVCASITLSFSRAGIISMTIVIIGMNFSNIRIKKKTKIAVIIFAFFIVLFSCLYFLKKDSADGRLLIWRCSLNMIIDKPILGYGHGGFIANYMNYQAKYFEQNPDNKYTMLADNIHNPFNEYLLLLIDFGLLGFILFIAMSYFIWKEYLKNYKQSIAVQASGWSLISIMIFSFFSYPLSYPFVWVMGILSASLIISKTHAHIKAPLVVKLLMITIATVLCLLSYKDMHNEIIWNKINKESLAGHTVKVLPEYERLREKFCCNRFFMYDHAAELNNIKFYSKSLAIADECSQIWADYYLQLMIGDNYIGLKKYRNAEKYYKNAAHMCPSRFIPLYKLFQLYLSVGEKDKALIIANEIINKPIKIMSPTVKSIKLSVLLKKKAYE